MGLLHAVDVSVFFVLFFSVTLLPIFLLLDCLTTPEVYVRFMFRFDNFSQRETHQTSLRPMCRTVPPFLFEHIAAPFYLELLRHTP